MSSLHDNPWRWQTTPLRRSRNGLRRLNNRNNNNTTPRRSSGSSSSRMVEGRATTITIVTIPCLPEDYIGSEILCSLSRRSCCHHQHHLHQHQHPQHHHHQHPPRERTTNRVSFLLYRRLHCLLLLPLPSTRIITIKVRKMADIKQNEKKSSKKKKRKRGKKNLCGITGGQK